MTGQLIVEGLAIGACYGLFGVAVVIIYKTSAVLNFAQAEMAMFCTFIAYHFLTYYHWPFWVSFIVTMAFAISLGTAIEFVFLRPAKHPTLLGLIVITLGVEMLLLGLATWKWGGDVREFNLPMSYQVTHEPIKGFVISNWGIGIFITAFSTLISLYLFFKFSKLGLAMRVTQQNQRAAKIMGIRVDRIISLAWGISSLIGAISAMFIVTRVSLEPGFMFGFFLKTFAVAVLGGMMSIHGVFIAGGLLGLIENFFGYAWPEWKPIVAFLVIILVLCIRPSGLFAKHYVKKV